MRHKYDTRGIVVARTPLGEANTLVTVITPTLGLVRARAQGLRKSGAKLAAALRTLAQSELVLVQGREGWRVAGAVLNQDACVEITSYEARARAARVLGLLLRLVVDEARDDTLFLTVESFLAALARESEALHEAAELLVVLRTLRILGLDAGEMPGEAHDYSEALLRAVGEDRLTYITRINQGIAASGL
jgi:DNA repair protein RecO (recombination protein O)